MLPGSDRRADPDATLTCAAPTSTEPNGPFRAGQTVAERFSLIRELGEGGMGVVFEAIDSKLNERRALKFSKLGHAHSIPPEARSALRVTHENVCRTYEIHTTNTNAGPVDFISMEFVEGETLYSRLRREAIPPIEALDLARQLCKGLEAAHSAQILHRDLKTNNVMITTRVDSSPRAVIMDFGLARALNGATPASSGISGTPNYLAPERWKGAPASPSSDVYALGVIFYEMLTGKRHFPAEMAFEQRLTAVPEPPSRSERAPDPRWDSIVLGCLEPDPGKRFSSAAQVLESIDRAFPLASRRRWIAVAASVVALAASLFALREHFLPLPGAARLAVLPFSGSSSDKATDAIFRGGLHEVGARLESLGSASRRLTVIPMEDAARHQVDSPAKAGALLGASHALSGKLTPNGRLLGVYAAVTEVSSGEVVREFRADFEPADLASISTSLAAVVTSAFRLGKAPPARVAPAAYPHYAAGLASLRRDESSYEEAILQLQEALKRDSSSPLIHAELARGYLWRFTATKEPRWLDAASNHARRAESLHPDSPSVLVVLGEIERWREGRPERAVEYFKRAAELESGNSDAWRRTGRAYQQLGRDADAVTALRKAVELAPDYYAPHLTLGYVHFQKGRHEDAVMEFREVVRIAPGLQEGYAALGGALIAAEKEQEAEQALGHAVKLRATRAALSNLGVVLRYQGRHKEAVAVFEQALLTDSETIGVRLNLANALRSIGRAFDARANFVRASELARASLRRDPRDAAARAGLAYAMSRIGDPGLASDEALQAARLAPSDYTVLFWTTMTFEALGQREALFPLLAHASYGHLRDLRRQPDLSDLARDPKFDALLKGSEHARK